MKTPNNRLRTLALVMGIFLSHNLYAASAFDNGVRLFEQQQYQQAAKQFRQAIQNGDTRAVVYYNLAVSEYKTGKLDAAAKYFRQAAKDSKFYSSSMYSLGLIAAKQNKLKTAIRYFDKVKPGDTSLRRYADNAIARLRADSDAKKPASLLDHVHGLAALSYGRDSNVNRASDNSPSNVGDTFNSLYASVSMPFTADSPDFGFGASYFNINYSTLDTDDFSIARAGLFYKTRLANWKTRSMLSVSSSELGPDGFQSSLRLSLNGKYKLSSDASIKLDYQFDNLSSSTPLYDYLAGTRQRLRVAYRKTFGNTRIDARYRLETNNRNDLPTQSFSPVRHTVRVIAKQPLSNKLTVKADAAYRSSDYPAMGANPGRSDERSRLALRLQYRFDKHWSLEAYARHTNNDSSNPLFKYQRDDAYLTLGYTF